MSWLGLDINSVHLCFQFISVSSQQIKNCWDCPYLLPSYKLPLCDFVFTSRILSNFSQISPTHSPSFPRLILGGYDLFQAPHTSLGWFHISSLTQGTSAISPNLKQTLYPLPLWMSSTAPSCFPLLANTYWVPTMFQAQYHVLGM